MVELVVGPESEITIPQTLLPSATVARDGSWHSWKTRLVLSTVDVIGILMSDP